MITRLALWLLWACRHRWETVREVPLCLRGEDGRERATGTRYHLRCTKCGDVRKRDLV